MPFNIWYRSIIVNIFDYDYVYWFWLEIKSWCLQQNWVRKFGQIQNLKCNTLAPLDDRNYSKPKVLVDFSHAFKLTPSVMTRLSSVMTLQHYDTVTLLHCDTDTVTLRKVWKYFSSNQFFSVSQCLCHSVMTHDKKGFKFSWCHSVSVVVSWH